MASTAIEVEIRVRMDIVLDVDDSGLAAVRSAYGTRSEWNNFRVE